jgi:hypothetical protein
MSYKNLEIWQLSRELVIDIHKMTLKKLPSFEMYEEGRQIRRSIKTVETLFETESLKDKELYVDLHQRLELLGKKLNLFIQSVERSHKSEK